MNEQKIYSWIAINSFLLSVLWKCHKENKLHHVLWIVRCSDLYSHLLWVTIKKELFCSYVIRNILGWTIWNNRVMTIDADIGLNPMVGWSLNIWLCFEYLCHLYYLWIWHTRREKLLKQGTYIVFHVPVLTCLLCLKIHDSNSYV